MAKEKTAYAYELELRNMIKKRTKADMEVWLKPQVRATAANMVMLDKIQEELIKETSLVDSSKTGSMGQQKSIVNPLVPYYDKMQRTLLLQFEALGLNYNATPSKINGHTGKELDEDLMANYYKGRKS